MLNHILNRIKKEIKMFNDKKLIAIQECLDENINMPTKTVVKTVLERYFISVSERYVQKVRKEMKEDIEWNKNVKGEGDDMFDTGKGGMKDWEIDVLNMANEGGWTIQQISERINKDTEDVRGALTDFHYMLSSPVLDEEEEGVYFQPDGFVPDTDINNNIINLPAPAVVAGAPDINRSATREDYWEIPLPECVTECSKTKKEVNVFIGKEARKKAMLFMKWAKAREWLAYLVGEKIEDEYFIHDLYLPDQRTSATLVDKVVADEYNKLSIMGVIHSHHEMGAGDEDRPSFSGHDNNFINSNHNLSLLAGRDRATGGFKVVGIARVTTPCGGIMKVKAVVKAMKEEATEEEKALKAEFFGKVFSNPPTPINGKNINVGGREVVVTRGSYHFSPMGKKSYPAT
jgi:hypothetical protein